MSKDTSIAWTNHTFNLVWGCTKVSPGCKNCYAEALSKRYGFSVWGENGQRRTFGAKHWAEPLAWQAAALKAGERRRVFCGSMCDWAEDHPTTNGERVKLWQTIKATPALDWLLLTKRPERLPECMPADWGDGWANVWMGTSIESGDYNYRADSLRAVPARVRFISYEPALGPIDGIDLTRIHWLIFGGESGAGFRAPDGWQDWARAARDLCAKAGTAFFFKQSPGIRSGMGETLDGVETRQYPKPWPLDSQHCSV